MPQHRWKKGEITNPRGRSKKISAFAEYLRETTDWEEVRDAVMSVLRGEPFVTVLDQETGLPKLAERSPRQSPSYTSIHAPGAERPKPLAKLGPKEQVFDIKIPTPAERLAAATWLGTWAGQKPPAEMEMNVNHSENLASEETDFSKFTPEQLDRWLELQDILNGGSEPTETLNLRPILDVVSVEVPRKKEEK